MGEKSIDNMKGNEMIKYKTLWGEISKVEIVKETEHFVFLEKGREKKRSEWQNYFDTFDDAKKFLLEKAKNQVEMARGYLQAKRDILGNIKGLNESNIDK